MRRWLAYISLFFAALLICGALAGCGLRDQGTAGAVPSADASSAAAANSFGWDAAPVGTGTVLSGPSSGVAAGNGVRCSWLTGLRRELSSPVFQTLDLCLSYRGRLSAARSFASWRASLCGASCGGAVSVLQPGDGYVFALRRIVI